MSGSFAWVYIYILDEGHFLFLNVDLGMTGLCSKIRLVVKQLGMRHKLSNNMSLLDK